VAVDLTLILQFLLITYSTTIILYFISGLLIKQKDFRIFTFLFLLPLFSLNVIAVVINRETFPILSPITFILATLAFILGQISKRKDARDKHSLMFYSLLIVSFFSFFFFSLYFTPHFLFKKNREKISGTLPIYDKLEFSNLDGTSFELNILKNKTILIDNWFLSCYQCNLKLPSLQSLSDKIASDTAIKIISVINGKIDSLTEVIEFARSHKEFKIPILYDKNNTLGKLIKVDGYPIELIINKEGVLKERHDGFNKDERLIYVNETFKKLTSYNN